MPNRRLVVKPPFGTKVNWAHPLAQYLRGFWMFNEGAGLSTVNLAAPSNDMVMGGTTPPTWTTTQFGAGINFTGSAAVTTLLGGTGAVVDNINPLTWEVLIYLRALSSYSARTTTKAGDGTTTYNSLMIGSSGDLLYTFSRATTILDFESSISLLSGGNYYHLIATLDKNTDACHMYINGVEPSMALTQVGAGAYVDDTARGLCFGNRPAGDRTLDGVMIYARYFNMYCDAVTAWELYSNPHALLATPPRRFFAAPSAGAFTQALAGTLTSSGALTKQTGKALAGTLTDSGALTKRAGKALAGTLTDSGALTKRTNKALAGTLTSSGALAAIRTVLKALAGTLTTSGALTKRTGKALAGTLTTSGALTKRINKALAGTLTSSGALTSIRTFLKALAGTLTTAGTLTKQTGKALAGTLTTSGTLSRQIGRQLAGTLGMAGTLSRQTAKALAGTLATAGELTRQINKTLAGVLTMAGALATAMNVATIKFKGGLRARAAKLTGKDPAIAGRDAKLSGRNIDGDV